jgi:hypothetical protein
MDLRALDNAILRDGMEGRKPAWDLEVISWHGGIRADGIMG